MTPIFTTAAAGEHHLMLGSIVCTTLLSGAETMGELGVVELRCPIGSGPGPHTDPWRESFYLIEGEFEFMLEEDGLLKRVKAGPGDALSAPAGVGHAFRAIAGAPARVLITSVPAGLEAFFADAGERVDSNVVPATPQLFDRSRFEQATDRHGIKRFQSRSANA